MDIVGIDYGSKLAGTTSIVLGNVRHEISEIFEIKRSKKSEDADAFVLETMKQFLPSKVFIDAPLSLPAVYAKLSLANAQSDFFYRKADRLAAAMSPLFLGGLTARAMRLKFKLMELGVEVYEVYPGLLARHLDLAEYQYKKKDAQIEMMISKVNAITGISIHPSIIKSSHDFVSL